jgi:hypothetical protein
MPGLFSRIKTWIGNETLKSADLNAEFDNVINNFEPDKMDDHSPDIATMQQTTDPGEVGSENLATSTAEEIEQLRFAVAEIKGTDQWYQSPATDLGTLTSSGTTPENRVVSGATLSSSNQPAFLIPSGSTNEVTLDASPDELRVAINNTITTFSSDIVLTGLQQGPTANHTMTINDTTLAGGEETKVIGEGASELVCDATGSAINAKNEDWGVLPCVREVFCWSQYHAHPLLPWLVLRFNS